MADFYDDFKNNINNRSEPDFNSADWSDMDARLNERPRQNIPLFWWSTAALILLLLGSNAWWFSQNKKADDKISTEINTVVLRDTIIQKEIIYQIDTVVQIQRILEIKNNAAAKRASVVAQSFASNNPFLNNKTTFISQESILFKKGFTAKDILVRAISSLQKSNSSSNDFQNSFTFSDIKNDTKEEENNLAFLTTDLKSLPTASLNFFDESKGLPLLKREKYRRHVLRNAWREIQPTGFGLEAIGTANFLLNSEIESQSSVGAGLIAAVEFSPTLRFWMSGNFEQLKYKSNTQGDLYNVPVINPPSAEFDFKYAEVSLPTLHFASGLQYYFRSNKKWSPYIGIGIGGRALYEGEAKYEFENGNLEIKEERTLPNRDFQLEYLDFQTGIVYKWNENWKTRLGFEYLQYTQKESISALRFQLGIGYRF